MKSTLFVRILLLSGLIAFGSAASVTASASDEFAGALIGAGAGAVIGNSINHREGAVVGGIFGAILGAAIADNDHDRDRDRYVVRDRYYPAPVYRHPVDARPYYPPVPLVSYPAPRVRVVTQPVYVDVHPSHDWRYDRDGRRDDRRWDRDHDRRHDGRGDRSRW